jgi:hypothetical protein
MLLYNVTVGIDKEIEKEWLQYMQERHIPGVLRTGMFVSNRMYKVLHDQEDGVFAPVLIEDHKKKFANRHVTFMTLLEEVNKP